MAVAARNRQDETAVLRPVDRYHWISTKQAASRNVARLDEAGIVGAGEFRAGVAIGRHVAQIDGDRNRIANRAHHNFRFTLETVPPEELPAIKKFMDGVDVMKPMEDRVDPDLVNDYLVHRFSIAGNPKECIERIEELKAAGVDHLMLTPARKVYTETVEAFAKGVAY